MVEHEQHGTFHLSSISKSGALTMRIPSERSASADAATMSKSLLHATIRYQLRAPLRSNKLNFSTIESSCGSTSNHFNRLAISGRTNFCRLARTCYDILFCKWGLVCIPLIWRQAWRWELSPKSGKPHSRASLRDLDHARLHPGPGRSALACGRARNLDGIDCHSRGARNLALLLHAHVRRSLIGDASCGSSFSGCFLA